MTRRAGLLVPLFSAVSTRSWGVGDIGDLDPLSRWLADAGQRILQLLPLNEMATGHNSPYSAMSAMAIDPIYIAVGDVEDFIANGGDASLTADDRAGLDIARSAGRVIYEPIRAAKYHALSAAFERFARVEWAGGSARAAAFRDYISGERWWLDDYAIFRALHDREERRSWTEWPEPLRRRDPEALAQARRELGRDVLFYQYLQWIAGSQWQHARAVANARGVALFGDLPFMVDTHSADVWANQAQFRLDRSVGVPPDAFSATGQDWGMPPYDWQSLGANGYGWLRARARRSAALYDGYRVDHLVGFYRTYSRPRLTSAKPAFEPATEAEQEALGEKVLGIFHDSGAEIIAEDLGTVPDFVRASLARLHTPGFKVFRWERDWDLPGEPFRDPANYPPVSVATTGTHDTEPMITWWEAAPLEERAAVATIPSLAAILRDVDPADAPFSRVRDALLELLMASRASVVLFPIQDVFGWADRINEPATVKPGNWTYRLPWPIDTFASEPVAQERQASLRRWTRTYARA